MSDMVAKIDDLGRPAWIAVMIGGFILFWPVGLAVLTYLIWSGRMACGRAARYGAWSEADPRARWERKMERLKERMERWGEREQGSRLAGLRPTGNRAFDEYRTDTLRQLEQEANEFGAFLDRLRMAKDKSEFDQFMTERRNQPPAGGTGAPTQG